MALKPLLIHDPANSGLGDTARAGAIKISAPYSSTYVATATQFGGVTKEQTITLTISAALADGATRVLIPGRYDLDGSAMLPYAAASVVFNAAVQIIREGGNHAICEVEAYGAHADGTTDDTAAITAANLCATVLGCDVGFLGHTYRLSGTYTISAPSRWVGQSGQGTLLNWLNNPVPAIIFNNSPPPAGIPSTQKFGWGMRGIRLQPSIAQQGTAIQFGSSSTNLSIGLRLDDVDVIAWNIGWQLGISGGANIINCFNCRVLDCNNDILMNSVGAGGERLALVGCAFSQGIGKYAANISVTQGFTDLYFIACSLDSVQVSINTDVTSRVVFSECHFENPPPGGTSGGPVDGPCLVLAGTGGCDLVSCLLSQDVNNPTMTGYISQSGGQLTVVGGTMDHAGSGTLPAMIAQTGGLCTIVSPPTLRNTTQVVTSTVTSGDAGVISPVAGIVSSPAALSSGNNNNFASVTQRQANLRVAGNADNTSVITGLAVQGGNIPGHRLALYNIGASAIMGLTHQDANSTATNQIITPSTNTLVLRPGEGVQLLYDGVTTKWRVLDPDRLNAVTLISSPGAFPSGNTNDWAAPQYGETARISANAAGSTITGIAMVGGNLGGRRFRIINISANNLTISNADASSAAGNRFLCVTGASIVLTQNQWVDLEYDSTTASWRAR